MSRVQVLVSGALKATIQKVVYRYHNPLVELHFRNGSIKGARAADDPSARRMLSLLDCL